MNAIDCCGFEDAGDFFQALEKWEEFNGKATYLIVCGRRIPRLFGNSDILYIRKTKNLGGNVNSRMWNYENAGENNRDYRIKAAVGRLVAEGDAVSLHIYPDLLEKELKRNHEKSTKRNCLFDTGSNMGNWHPSTQWSHEGRSHNDTGESRLLKEGEMKNDRQSPVMARTKPPIAAEGPD